MIVGLVVRLIPGMLSLWWRRHDGPIIVISFHTPVVIVTGWLVVVVHWRCVIVVLRGGVVRGVRCIVVVVSIVSVVVGIGEGR